MESVQILLSQCFAAGCCVTDNSITIGFWWDTASSVDLKPVVITRAHLRSEDPEAQGLQATRHTPTHTRTYTQQQALLSQLIWLSSGS